MTEILLSCMLALGTFVAIDVHNMLVDIHNLIVDIKNIVDKDKEVKP